MSVTTLPKLYTEQDAASYLKCSRAVVRKLRMEGKLTHTLVANKVLFNENDIRRLLGMEPVELTPMEQPKSSIEFPSIPILSKEALASLSNAFSIDGPGVYFLWLGQELSYIGQSERVSFRVAHHRQACGNNYAKSIEFEMATAMSVQWPYHLAVEAAYIRAYPTKGNRKA